MPRTDRFRSLNAGVDVSQVAAPCVLVAEDDSEMRNLIASSLGNAGYRVVEVKDGHELLDYVRLSLQRDSEIRQPDLVVTDLRMPGWSGLEILSVLRRINWSTKVILITAFGDEQTHAEAECLCASAVFDKPFDPKELCEFVLRLLPLGA